MINMLKKLFNPAHPKNNEYEYLAGSKDLSDLERRQRQIERGHAPWQPNHNLKGWV